MKKRPSLTVSFEVAAVWFGALLGPSLVTGAYIAVYFAPYGNLGLLLPFVAFLPICILAAMSADIVRRCHAYDYASFGKALYGRLHKYLMPFLDYFIIMAMIIGGSAVANVEGSLLGNLLHVPEVVGASIFGIITVVVAMFGAGMLRRFSAGMTAVLFFSFIALAVLFIRHSPVDLSTVLTTEGALSDQYGHGIFRAVLLGFSNTGCVCGTLCAVEQGIKTRRQAVFVGVFSFLLNSCIFLLGCIMILPYCPAALSSPTPTVYIIQNHILSYCPWLFGLYNFVMFLALLSSDAPQLFAVSSRIIAAVDKKGRWQRHSERTKILVIGTAYEALCVLISTFGLTAIISKGYTLNGWMGLFLVAIPILIRFFRDLRARRNT